MASLQFCIRKATGITGASLNRVCQKASVNWYINLNHLVEMLCLMTTTGVSGTVSEALDPTHQAVLCCCKCISDQDVCVSHVWNLVSQQPVHEDCKVHHVTNIASAAALMWCFSLALSFVAAGLACSVLQVVATLVTWLLLLWCAYMHLVDFVGLMGMSWCEVFQFWFEALPWGKSTTSFFISNVIYENCAGVAWGY